MSGQSKWEYFKTIYRRYQQALKEQKQQILDEFCQVCHHNRKYAIRKLNGPNPWQKLTHKRRKRFLRYPTKVIEILQGVWESAGYPWSVRLKAILPLWMPWMGQRFGLTSEIEKQLLSISARQIDRRLGPKKIRLKKRLYGRTKPGSLLKHHIPIKTDHWDVKIPGFTEIDLVSHSGNCASGEFAHSVNQTDILTTWVESRAVLGKGEQKVLQAMDDMEQSFPFKILGIDSDNGSEFINDHLYRRCKLRKIQFTRGRPYKKDDNAHIEQKNWTHVRKLLGWDRYDSLSAVQAINDLYKNDLRFFQNLFLPNVKLKEKKRVGSKLTRVYDTPKTPFQRLLDSKKGDPAKIAPLLQLSRSLNPFDLATGIDKKLDAIYSLVNHRYQPKPLNPSLEKPKRSITVTPIQKQVLKKFSRNFGITFHTRDSLNARLHLSKNKGVSK